MGLRKKGKHRRLKHDWSLGTTCRMTKGWRPSVCGQIRHNKSRVECSKCKTNSAKCDVKTVSLNGRLKQAEYMEQPEGFKDGTMRVCMLN